MFHGFPIAEHHNLARVFDNGEAAPVNFSQESVSSNNLFHVACFAAHDTAVQSGFRPEKMSEPLFSRERGNGMCHTASKPSLG